MHFRHAKEKRDRTRLSYKGWRVFISVAIFWIFVSIIPLYNKVVFSGVAGDRGFPYPLTTTFFQLSLCALLLTLISVVQHWKDPTRSWIFDKSFLFKLRHTWKIGFFFGLKFGVTNWGLKLIPIAPHLLLQSTDIMWTVLFAHLLNRERLDRYELLCCLGTLMGSILIALRTYQTMPGIFPIAINLFSPVLLGLCISELRRTAEILLIKNNSISGKVPFMNAFELTAFKLWFSSIVVLPFAFAFEGFRTAEQRFLANGEVSIRMKPSVVDALSNQSSALTLAAIGGGFLIMIFQVNVTWLAKLTSAISVGIVGGVKIIPQWLTALLVSGQVDTNVYHLVGAGLLIISSISWTRLKYGSISENVEEMQRMTDHLRYEQLLSEEALEVETEASVAAAAIATSASSRPFTEYGSIEKT